MLSTCCFHIVECARTWIIVIIDVGVSFKQQLRLELKVCRFALSNMITVKTDDLQAVPGTVKLPKATLRASYTKKLCFFELELPIAYYKWIRFKIENLEEKTHAWGILNPIYLK